MLVASLFYILVTKPSLETGFLGLYFFFLRQKLGWVLIFASSVPKVCHAWLLLLEILPLSMGQVWSNNPRDPRRTFPPTGWSQEVCQVGCWCWHFCLGGHLVDSAGLDSEDNLEQS